LGDELSEEEPRLYPSGSELYQHTQALLAILALSSRIRGYWQARLTNDGRLAHSDHEQADLLHIARRFPPVRLMTDAEEQEWLGRMPPDRPAPAPDVDGFEAGIDRADGITAASLAARADDSSAELSVWTQPLGTEWAVEARTWNPATGQPTATARVVCRDGDDAIQLCRWLRDHQRPEDISELHAAASGGALVGNPRRPAVREPTPTLTEDAWASALRGVLPDRLADQIIVNDPTHAHHTAWRELHNLAAAEVARIGADPHHLAHLVHNVPRWRDGIRNPPALAHWAITEARSSSDYERAARGELAASGRAPTHAPTATRSEGDRIVLDRVHTHADAVRWARGLDAANPVHRAEAGHGFGRWGSSVDAILTRTFPDLVDVTRLRGRRTRHTDTAQSTVDSTVGVVMNTDAETAMDSANVGANIAAAQSGAGTSNALASTVVPATDHDARVAGAVVGAVAGGTRSAARLSPAGAAELTQYARRLDPRKAGDRLAALAMLGHGTPDADRVLIDRFGEDPRFARKLLEVYPDGLPEAAAWRGRAEAREQHGAAAMTAPDDPSTLHREDLDGRAASVSERRTAEHQLAAATTVEHPAVEAVPAREPGPGQSTTRPPVPRSAPPTTARSRR
jgi:hypothetical protein